MVSPLASEARFRTPRSTLFFDRAMTWFIKIGGMAVILAVFTMLVFILWQVVPLFRAAQLTEQGVTTLPPQVTAPGLVALGLDEWGELPFVLDRAGTVTFIPFAAGAAGTPRSVALPLPAGVHPSSWLYLPRYQRLCIGGDDGSLTLIQIAYQAAFKDGVRTITGALKPEYTIPLGEHGRPLTAVACAAADGGRLVAGLQAGADGAPHVLVATLNQEEGLGGGGKVDLDKRYDLTAQVAGRPTRVLLDERGESVLVADDQGALAYLFKADSGFTLRQRFRPFEDREDAHLSSLDYLLGDVSLVVTNPAGANRIFSLYHKDGSETRLFGQTKELPALTAGADGYAMSVRNKAFMLISGRNASLRYGTSASIRWQSELPFTATAVALSAKYERLALLDGDGRLHLYALHDPHPESGFASLFGRIWYEGADAPKYEWQSTGSDESEPKLSMVPLIAGTLKGTFYALLFAVPIALLGAVYTSEFMHPRFKSVVKPTVEIMASLPSVVLGFLAALWLAPLIEHHVPALMVEAVVVPGTAMLFGWWWARLPMRYRSRIRPGYEFIAFTPLMLVAAVVAWNLGPALEWLAFSVTDPATHARIGDFPRWWHEATGLKFEQRNSLVVGIMMGFAVIPIVFTIAEDALSNVPSALRSGSLALGASRWQTAFKVVVPTASAGIFSGLMIGLGRAIGETMIVVMATGNTAIMNMNIFDGMRTLSANIAVELSEAPQDGTLYRTLFLGAFLLFLLTFVINTAAELLRQHLREKYKTV
jgi:phosphate transport system permease protein